MRTLEFQLNYIDFNNKIAKIYVIFVYQIESILLGRLSFKPVRRFILSEFCGRAAAFERFRRKNRRFKRDQTRLNAQRVLNEFKRYGFKHQ